MNYSDFKCNKQLEEKTRLFRKGFLKVMKSEWLSMFNNQELNLIISGSHADYSVEDLMYNSVFNGYHGKDETIGMLWQVVKEFSLEEKAQFLFFVTSCSRPPTLGFSHLKPLFCVQRSDLVANLPTANTCMNILRLPNYKNKAALKEKLLYAIKAKAGFEFAWFYFVASWTPMILIILPQHENKNADLAIKSRISIQWCAILFSLLPNKCMASSSFCLRGSPSSIWYRPRYQLPRSQKPLSSFEPSTRCPLRITLPTLRCIGFPPMDRAPFVC